ncbi:hypothetical protein P175DRAFT_0435332 [Aspergillus ochraceoroseus IBT 24754]|uniref:Uncharacterized protein n=2 Tax=Aspergillus ochraceoroseus TaxID=138278 RepID=A0A2T5LYZ4_9EURO|nr:uncharacterized protein P175DRAFT_0435332 [Aspergillus ochraceoroseus IBT 24754]KKK19172.1 hypothetical protein AOCH_003361 [Aspergillus ochraceoroseus]PTU21510.1 hypothetical protein P175DRAFT_0435332 [Aspergillus ochraceoroseus IBT 24754]
MDTGGLAQMTYNSSFNNGTSLGVPGSSFGSRRKGPNVKRLSVPPPHISTIDESQHSATVATPRTSRSHLLAGLRTAPKSATVPSANQRRQHLGLEGDRYGNPSNRTSERNIPQTATGTGFPQYPVAMNQGLDVNMGRPMYTLPEQVLAPPAIEIASDLPMDESLYAELMSTNLFLAAQQQRLQQQLISVTAAAQQFQGLSLGVGMGQQQDYSPLSVPGMGFYQQQLQQGVQPVVQPISGQPGLYSVYNPLTGQLNYVYDNSVQQDLSPPYQQDEEIQSPAMHVPPFRAEVSPPPESSKSPVHLSEGSSSNSSPCLEDDISPLPPPSANAFRRTHKKNTSFGPGPKTGIDTNKANSSAHTSGPKTAPLATPATGTFGPGQGRAGEHPIRQPRGPPSLEELVAKPTSKYEGSKNFATRQRRRAVHNLVRAGIERRGETRSLGHSSGGTNTPASEKEFTFSDGDDATVRSGSLSSKPSLGSLRAAANGAIGSERKERSSRERKSQDSLFNTTPLSEDSFFGGKFADQASPRTGTPSVAAVVAGQKTVAQGTERRKTPMLVLSSAEKRKTPIM